MTRAPIPRGTLDLLILETVAPDAISPALAGRKHLGVVAFIVFVEGVWRRREDIPGSSEHGRSR